MDLLGVALGRLADLGLDGWADMGLVSKKWAWVVRNGLRRCKGAE